MNTHHATVHRAPTADQVDAMVAAQPAGRAYLAGVADSTHPKERTTARGLLAVLSVSLMLGACASIERPGSIQDQHTQLLIYPDSVRPHNQGRITDWEARIMVNFLARPRPAIADGKELLPLSGRPDINRNLCRIAITNSGNFDCIYSGLLDLVFHCGAQGRKPYITRSVLANGGNSLRGNVLADRGPETGSLRVAESGSLIEQAYDQVCGRPEAKDSIARAAAQEAAERERQRLAGAEAWRRHQAETEARERQLAQERERRQLAQAAEQLRLIDEGLQRAESELKKGDDYTACNAAKEASERARGTDRLSLAQSTQKRICDQHERLAAQRRAASREEEARERRLCQGTPRVPRPIAENIARRLSTNPLNLSFNRLQYDYSCRIVVYHPGGVVECSVDLDSLGTVQRINSCR